MPRRLIPGRVVGGDGFSFERNEVGVLERFPHYGGVVISDDVEVGANSCVDRGTLGNTVIGRGTKIDNLVHIAHNVVVGNDCVIVALALIGGGVRLGDRVWIAPTACIRDGSKTDRPGKTMSLISRICIIPNSRVIYIHSRCNHAYGCNDIGKRRQRTS